VPDIQLGGGQASCAARIKAYALGLGFDLVGIAPARPSAYVDFYRRWLEAGYHGHMAYLARPDAVEKRARVDTLLAGARSVISVGLTYQVSDLPARIRSDPSRGLIARYAWDDDYHHVMLPRLRTLAGVVERLLERPVDARAYVDTGPLLEREYAVASGLGFVGRNSMLINPDLGSYLFLGELVVDADLEYDLPATRGTCGTCRRCLTACPTDAFQSPYVLDSRRCISYLTIELRGPIPRHLRPRMGNWVFGCDICQEVCPWVKRLARRAVPRPVVDAERVAPRLLNLIHMDDAAFKRAFGGTAVARAKRSGFLRNVAVALGNWGSPQAIPALRHALHDPEPLVRGHAAWALARCAAGADEYTARSVADVLEEGAGRESNTWAREEISLAARRVQPSKA
jgi:epoxyqueuosine reductase